MMKLSWDKKKDLNIAVLFNSVIFWVQENIKLKLKQPIQLSGGKEYSLGVNLIIPSY